MKSQKTTPRRLIHQALGLMPPSGASLFVRSAVLSSLMLASGILAHAGDIVGTVRDAERDMNMIGASVTIEELNRTVVIDTDGNFGFYNLSPGSYTLTTSFMGYENVRTQVSVPETGEARADVLMKTDIIKMDQFVVGGTREGQARALQQKQTAPNVLDIVSADAAGKLPDGNAAEALRRLPGVVAEIDQNEARYIVVRGMDSALNNVTINGQLIGSPDGTTRAVAMDAVPADLIARIELSKAVTPDMDHNAIGGSVNIVTPSAFDRSEAFANASGSFGYSNLTGDTVYNFSATYGTTFADKKWGFIVGASFSNRDYGSYRMSGGAWTKWKYPAVGATPAWESQYYAPTEQNYYNYTLNRRRSGINASLEFRPTDNIILYARINYNTFRDDESRDGRTYSFGMGTLTNQTPTSGTFSQGRSTRELRSYQQNHLISSYQLGGEAKLGAGKLEANVTYGRAERETPRRIDWEYRSTNAAWFANTYDTSIEDYMVTPTNPDKVYDAASYPFRRVRYRSDDESEDTWSGDINYKLENDLFKLPGYWKTGLRYYSRDKVRDRTNSNYEAAKAYPFTLADFGIGTTVTEDFFNGYYRYGPGINFDKAEAFKKEHPEYFSYVALTSAENSAMDDIGAKENVYAGYLMRQVVAGPWMFLAGVRVERTEAEYSANDLQYKGGTFTGNYSKITGESNYTDVLPGFHIRYSPMKELVFRGAWTNTIGRPSYVDLAPNVSYEYAETVVGSGIYTGGISGGNAKLKPYESMNFDLSAEYYLKKTGIVSVGFFHKEIKNPVYKTGHTELNYTYNGLFFERFDVNQPQNADKGHVTGVELSYQQYFTFLPEPFNGLGFGANYTWTDSSVDATVVDASKQTVHRTTTFFKQAKGAGNIALYYEKYRWNARVALNYSGSYIKSISYDPNNDNYADARKTIDAKLSFRLNKNWTLYAEMQNIAEEPLREYTGAVFRTTGIEEYSWIATIGANWKM